MFLNTCGCLSLYLRLRVYVYEYVCSKYVYTGWSSNNPTKQICVSGFGGQETVEKHIHEAGAEAEYDLSTVLT